MSLPSRELLPEYMKSQRWLDLADAIDAVFGTDFDLQQQMLKYLRYQFIESTETKKRVEENRLISFNSWDMPDRDTAAKQVELSGLRFYDTTFLTRNLYVNLFRNIGDFWYSKGLYDFIDFIGYSLNINLEMLNLWTQDYVTFIPEQDLTAAQIPIYQPNGTWYPTTHVRLRADATSFVAGISDVLLVGQLFLDLANYNLVLDAIEEFMKMWIGPQGATPDAEGRVTSDIVMIGNVVREKFTLTTAP